MGPRSMCGVARLTVVQWPCAAGRKGCSSSSGGGGGGVRATHSAAATHSATTTIATSPPSPPSPPSRHRRHRCRPQCHPSCYRRPRLLTCSGFTSTRTVTNSRSSRAASTASWVGPMMTTRGPLGSTSTRSTPVAFCVSTIFLPDCHERRCGAMDRGGVRAVGRVVDGNGMMPVMG